MVTPDHRSQIIAEARRLVQSGNWPHLIAFLFATTEWLFKEHPTTQMRSIQPADSSDALTLPENLTDNADLYSVFLSLLLAIDLQAAREPWRWSDLPPSTSLSPGLPFSGTVHHRIRPRSAWRALREQRLEFGDGPMQYGPSPGGQLRAFAMELQQSTHAAVVRREPSHAGERLGIALEKGSLKIAFCPLLDAAGPRFTSTGNRFLARLDHPPIDTAALTNLLTQADKHKISILLLPELHLRPQDVQQIRDALEDHPHLLLVAAGSFHVERNAETWNLAPLLGWPGDTLWEHKKKGLFRLTRAQLDHLPPGAIEPLPTGLEALEAISLGTTLQFLDTHLGRIAILICADCLDPHAYQQAVRDVKPDLLFVVSLSVETAPFETRADEWATLGISTFYVNAGYIQPKLHAFANLALVTPAHLPAPKVRWLADGTIEVWHPHRKPKKGPPLDQDSAHIDPILGLVLDLGAHIEQS